MFELPDFERLDRSFELLKACSAIFLKHRGLLVFPFISSLASVLVVASFAMPLGGMHALGALSGIGAETVLLYPKWLPGTHAPEGPIDRIAGLRITASGAPCRTRPTTKS